MLRLLCLALALNPLVHASAAEPHDSRSGAQIELRQDRFVSGERTEVREPVNGDLIVAGRRVEVAASTGGDALVAGGRVRVTGEVGQDAYFAGGDVAVSGTISRNARIAGGSVLLEDDSIIRGNASLAGGEVDASGQIMGYLQTTGGEIYLNGQVGGDVHATGGEIELGPNAEIGGTLYYRSPEELTRDEGAQVGGLERLSAPERDDWAGVASWGFWLWTLGVIVLGVVLVAALPRFSRGVGETARQRFGWSLLIGLIALVAIPVAIAIAMITVIGIPIGIVLLLSYALLLLTGYVFAGIALGDASLQRLRPARLDTVGWRVGAAALALLVLALLFQIPFLGGLIALLALFVGMGALLRQLRFQAPAAP